MKKLLGIAGLFSLWILLIGGGCLGLRDVRVAVPQAIIRGKSATFLCHFDLEGDALYSVKWYKGRREFYRYTPKEDPAMKIFPIPGLHVDKKQSSDTKLTLKKLEPFVSGRYSCEVSADAPSFHTSLVSADMEVVDIPKDRPIIVGVRARYRMGEVLHSNCSSSWSMPAAKLNWFVNDAQASLHHLTNNVTIKDRHHNLEMSILGLRLLIQPHLFEGGRLKIRCIARIHDVYWQSTEKSVEEDKPKTSVQETMGPEFIPHFTEISTTHPRFLDELDYEYNNIDEFPEPTTGNCPKTLDHYLLVVPLFVLLVVIR